MLSLIGKTVEIEPGIKVLVRFQQHRTWEAEVDGQLETRRYTVVSEDGTGWYYYASEPREARDGE